MTTPATPAARAREYIEVPASTPASECRGRTCRCLVYWVERQSRAKNAPPGKTVRIPVDCEDDAQCVAPSATQPGLGVNHFTTCPDANAFTKGPKR